MPLGAETFIKQIAEEAGKAVMGLFGTVGVDYMKSDRVWDSVTKADLLSEHIIVSAIRKKYPEHGIVAEESGVMNEGAEFLWVIDPIDGTQNFATRIPMFGVMLCLIHRGEVVLSVVNMPATSELFFARAGKGAYLNGKRIHCSQKKTLDNSSGSSSSTLDGNSGKFMRNLLKAAEKERIQLRSLGSFSVNACYTACGRKDWYVPLAGKVWDFAPVSLLLKEAGCKVTDTKGKPWKIGTLEMVAANPTLHKELLKLTKNV